MIELDDERELRAGDPGGMLEAVASLPHQIREGYELGLGAPDLPGMEDVAAVAVCGMGGSAISGDVLRALAAPRVGIPVVVVRSPELPAWCGRGTLVVASSYSGETAETLACFEEAVRRGCRTVVVTSGGTLQARAEELGLGRVLVPAGSVPRAAFGYLAIGRDIVRLLFEHGATTARSGDLVAEVLALFSIGLFPFSLFQLQLRTFYALQDTRTPALINIGSLLVNAGVNLLLVLGLGLGVRGLAIGHASSYVFASVVALLVLRRRLGGLDGAGLSASVLRSTGAAVLTAAAAFGTARGLGALVGTASLGAQALQVFGAVLVGLGVYLAAALIFRIEEVDTLKRQVLGRWRR